MIHKYSLIANAMTNDNIIIVAASNTLHYLLSQFEILTSANQFGKCKQSLQQPAAQESMQSIREVINIGSFHYIMMT